MYTYRLHGPTPRVSRNLIFAFEHPLLVSQNLVKEVQLGRLAGAFVSLPLPGLQCHSIGVVPKRHTSFTISRSRALFHPAFVDAFLRENVLKYAN